MSFVEINGWVGAIFLLGAYFAGSLNLVDIQGKSYQLLNILGAISLSYYTFMCKAHASMTVNIIWTFIGLSAMLKNSRMNKKIQKISSIEGQI